MSQLSRFAAIALALALFAILPAAAPAAAGDPSARAGAPSKSKPSGPPVAPVAPPEATFDALRAGASLRPAPKGEVPSLVTGGQPAKTFDTRNEAFWSWGVTQYQSGLNCTWDPYYETQVTSQVGYGGTATVPRVGERFNVVLLYSHPGQACSGGWLADLYTELNLPDGAQLAVDQNNGIRCFTTTRENPNQWVNVTNNTWSTPNGLSGNWCKTDGANGARGGINLGLRMMVTGTMFQIVVPVIATKELKGAANVPQVAEFTGTTESVVTTSRLAYPKVWANVYNFFSPTISYPAPSATDVTQTGAKTTAYVYNHFKTGNAYVELGPTTAYGQSSDAIPLGAFDAYTIHATWDALEPGRTYHWRARFVDSAGVTTYGPDQTFTTAADTQPPDTTIVNGPAGDTLSRDATFSFTGTEAGTFQCKLDAGAWQACTSPKAIPGPLAAGAHTFSVRALDGAGNADPTPATRSWAVVGPAVPGWAKPNGLGSTPAGASVRGDFNGDGRSDLAVGAPGENAGAGAVHVLYGSATGLVAAGAKVLDQDSASVGDVREAGDGFGGALVSGDFNGDRKADLAVAAPGEDIGTIADAGVVQVLLGRSTGLSGTGSQIFSQATSGVTGTAEPGDRFGTALAAGDFGGDGRADLAVGAPGDDPNAVVDAGVVHMLPGTSSGLTATGNQYWSQNSTGVADLAEAGDGFGATLSAANVTGGTQADLVIGVPAEDTGTIVDAGILHVLPGSAANLTAGGSQSIGQHRSDIADSAEVADGFASSLATGDFTGDGRADLAVGTPSEDLGAVWDAGAVQMLPGSAAGLTGAGSQLWSQTSGGVTDNAEQGDRFGSVLAAGNFGGDTKADLAIGVPGEGTTTTTEAGAVHVLPGAAGGLTATGSRLLGQEVAGVADSAEAGDRFGSSLTAANFGGTAQDELAVGVPAEDLGTVTDAGVVQVFPGSASGPTASGSQIWQQGSTGAGDTPEAGDGFGSALGR